MNFNTFSEEENESMNNNNEIEQDKYFNLRHIFQDSFLYCEQSHLFNLNINEKNYNNGIKIDNNIELNYLMNEKTGFTSKKPLESYEIPKKKIRLKILIRRIKKKN
jgi:hypothetical protein